MLGAKGYANKKDLKAAIGKPLQYVETSITGPEYKENGKVVMVGPDTYCDRRWYSTVTLKDGIIVKVQ